MGFEISIVLEKWCKSDEGLISPHFTPQSFRKAQAVDLGYQS